MSRVPNLLSRIAAALAIIAVLAVLAVVAVSGSSTAQVATEPAPPPGPLRVLLVGDSIMRQTGPALARQLGARFVVHNEAVNGSGLLTPALFDWPVHLRQTLRSFQPDIVVMTFIGNYTADPAQRWHTTDGHTVPDIYAPSFSQAWGHQADLAVAQMVDAGAEVVLVLPPPMISPRIQAVTDRLRAEYQQVAARWPHVTLVDAADAVGGPNGGWVPSRPTASGQEEPVRTGDTVHLAPHGQSLLAREVRMAIQGSRRSWAV
jgi:hypothetical protein